MAVVAGLKIRSHQSSPHTRPRQTDVQHSHVIVKPSTAVLVAYSFVSSSPARIGRLAMRS